MTSSKSFRINNLRCAFGQRKAGVDLGGDVIIEDLDLDLDLDTSIYECDFTDETAYAAAYTHIYNQIQSHFCLNLGGDHSIAVSTIAPLVDLYQDDVLVVWIDAHPDLNTRETSVSKNLHGMPVAALLGLHHHWFDGPKRALKAENLVYFGIRDIDPPEAAFMQDLDIPAFNSPAELINHIQQHPAKCIHISCDIDGLDPEIMSATGTPVPKGLGLAEVQAVITTCLPRLISFDLVEFNPLLGDSQKTLENIMLLLKTVLADKSLD